MSNFGNSGNVQEHPKIILRTPGFSGPPGPAGPPGPPGPAPSRDIGVIYLKNNTTPTTIAEINARAVVQGTMQTGTLVNFIKDPSSNSLKYTGDGGIFHIVATFSFTSGSQDICGFYIGRNQNPSSALDPNADRISESEIYANAGSSSNQPKPAAIQTVCQLNTNDRIFFIVQNQSSTSSITVGFLKFVGIE
jgi:hypothetical protein